MNLYFQLNVVNLISFALRPYVMNDRFVHSDIKYISQRALIKIYFAASSFSKITE